MLIDIAIIARTAAGKVGGSLAYIAVPDRAPRSFRPR